MRTSSLVWSGLQVGTALSREKRATRDFWSLRKGGIPKVRGNSGFPSPGGALAPAGGDLLGCGIDGEVRSEWVTPSFLRWEERASVLVYPVPTFQNFDARTEITWRSQQQPQVLGCFK